jgi:hypothetical protein
MRPAAQPRQNSAILSLVGLGVTLAGFGLLAFDAAVGVIAIPAGLALALAAIPTPPGRDGR